MVFLCRLKDDLVHFVMGTPPPKDKSQYISPNNDRTKLQNIQTRKLNMKKPKILRLVTQETQENICNVVWIALKNDGAELLSNVSIEQKKITKQSSKVARYASGVLSKIYP